MLIVRQRTREIGTLKALGASHLQITAQFAAEALMTTVLAIIVAAALTAAVGQAVAGWLDVGQYGFHSDAAGHIQTWIGDPVASSAAAEPLHLGLTPGQATVAGGAALALTIAGSVIAAFSIARIRPAEMLRNA
jgi:ABC-type antimicrobial peptide transport system permease subunit